MELEVFGPRVGLPPLPVICPIIPNVSALMHNFAYLALLLLLSVACDWSSETDNGRVDVNNNTSKTVKVSFSQEVALSEWESENSSREVEIRDKVAYIESGKSKYLYVDSQPFFDGEIWVTFSGNIKKYDLDYSIFGTETVHVNEQDFPHTGH